MAISANDKITQPPYMTPHQRRTLNELLSNLVVLIRDSGCTAEIKGKARTIIDYYLVNPFMGRLSNFFNLMRVNYQPTHTHAAESRYVPLLSMMLMSNYDMLQRQLEMLDMIAGLSFKPESVVTKTAMCDRFVEGLALYTEIDHSDLNQIMAFLPMHAFGCAPQLTGLKDLPQ